MYISDKKYRFDALEEMKTNSQKSNNKFFQLLHSIIIDETSPLNFQGYSLQFEDAFIYANSLFYAEKWDACLSLFNVGFKFFAENFETCIRLFQFVLFLHSNIFNTYRKVADFVLFQKPVEAIMKILHASIEIISKLKTKANEFFKIKKIQFQYIYKQFNPPLYWNICIKQN